MQSIYTRRTEFVRMDDVRLGDTLVDSRGLEWFYVKEIRPSGHTPKRLVISGLHANGLSYSHSAPKASLVRRFVGVR